MNSLFLPRDLIRAFTSPTPDHWPFPLGPAFLPALSPSTLTGGVPQSVGFCFSLFLFPLIFFLQQAQHQHNIAGAPQLGQELAGPTTAPSQYAYLSDFVFSRIGLGKQKEARREE